MNHTYTTAKLLITSGRCEAEHMMSCLDTFLMAKRITAEQYVELLLLLPEPETPPVEPPPADPPPDETVV